MKAKKDAKIVKTTPFADPGTRIGTDKEYNDTELRKCYKYSVLRPYNEHHAPKRARSLKDFASRRLAEVIGDCMAQHDGVESVSALIDATPAASAWPLWRKVWKYLLVSEQDSPALFQFFYARFGHEKTFHSHHFPSLKGSTAVHNEDRTSYVVINSLSRKHRFETLFSTVSLQSVVHDLNNCLTFCSDNLVFLSLAGIDVSKAFHALTGLARLTYLNLSRSGMDDTAVRSLFMAMNMGSKLCLLRCVLLAGNPGIQKALVAKDLPPQIKYLETDRTVEVYRSFRRVGNTSFVTLSDPLKLKYLVDHRLVQLEYKDRLVLDYRVVEKGLPEELDQDALEGLWAQRSKGDKIRGAQSFVRAKGQKRKRRPEPEVKKRRIAAVNFNQFFDI